MHILDIAQNSIKADAKNILVSISENSRLDTMTIKIKDDGCGMSMDMVKKVCDPFITSRTTRRVGLGIPLFKSAAEMAGGSFKIQSKEGIGTTVFAEFGLLNIDRSPLGDIGSTMSTLIGMNSNINFEYRHEKDDAVFSVSNKSLQELLTDIPIDSPEVISWIRDYINESIKNLEGGLNI